MTEFEKLRDQSYDIFSEVSDIIDYRHRPRIPVYPSTFEGLIENGFVTTPLFLYLYERSKRIAEKHPGQDGVIGFTPAFFMMAASGCNTCEDLTFDEVVGLAKILCGEGFEQYMRLAESHWGKMRQTKLELRKYFSEL